uniref:Transmembrane protease serine n=2 Tax=Chelydra serpentina TaxID=8475 RepID=A0A8C3THD4_CHESE
VNKCRLGCNILDQEMYFYNGTFKITNVQYNHEFDKHTSKEFRDLSTSIEMLVTNTFRASILNKKYIRSHVVNLSPDASGVVVELVLMFEFASNDNRAALSERVKSILLRRLQTNTGYLAIDHSTFKLSGKFLDPAKSVLSLIDCGIRRSKSLSYTDRITGGMSAQDGEWPWQASLQLSGIHRCGATLISDTWLVTAAHCFKGQQNPRRWTASFGTVVRPPQSRRSVRNIIIHEKYTDAIPNHDYDIAVVQLSSPVEFTNNIRMVCLPEEFYVFPHNTTCFVTGWGASRNEGDINNLRQAEVKIIDTNICNRAEVYNGVITPGMVCAGYLEGEIDACQGDSGGPLVTGDRRGIWYLVGIVSWGDECAKKNKPGVYTRVTYYRDWIAAKTGI